MWIVCLNSEQSGDKELIQQLSRSLSQVVNNKKLLIIRLPSMRDKSPDTLATLSNAKLVNSILNEAGIPIVSIEGRDKDLLKLNADGELGKFSMKWVQSLLKQGVVVSLSILGLSHEGDAQAISLRQALEAIITSDLPLEALIFMHKRKKRQVLAQDEPQSKIRWDSDLLDSRVLDENIIRELKDLETMPCFITSPIGLISKNLDKATSLIF